MCWIYCDFCNLNKSLLIHMEVIYLGLAPAWSHRVRMYQAAYKRGESALHRLRQSEHWHLQIRFRRTLSYRFEFWESNWLPSIWLFDLLIVVVKDLRHRYVDTLSRFIINFNKCDLWFSATFGILFFTCIFVMKTSAKCQVWYQRLRTSEKADLVIVNYSWQIHAFGM